MEIPFPDLSDYERLPEGQLLDRIQASKQHFGSRVVILGHHYQRAQIVKLSDFVGDSYGLSIKASESNAEKIVFCGVRFMAESAAILCKTTQKVYHPDPEAGCPMADMANMDQVSSAWTFLSSHILDKIVPITYMNSTAELKAFCGERDGIVCTSSNASQTFDWALGADSSRRIFFFPDEHLGRNTGKKYGIPLDQMVVWDPHQKNGGVDLEKLKFAKVILWKGYCPVHMEFKARDIKNVRALFPQCKVVVHPECDQDVLALADANGSTDFIVKYVTEQPEGSIVFVGTEVNLVTRLQKMFPMKKVFKLQRSLCLTMYQITLANLCYTLEHLDSLETVELTQNVKNQAKIALDRMIEVTRQAEIVKSLLPKSVDSPISVRD